MLKPTGLYYYSHPPQIDRALHYALENDGGRIAINPDRFDKLITALRIAVDNDGTLGKEATSYNDIF